MRASLRGSWFASGSFSLGKRALFVLAAGLAIFGTRSSIAQPYQPNWESLDRRPVPAWYLDAKFGIFIHWGVYAVPSWGAPKQYSEWYWNHIADKKPDNVWWQFHQRVYGADFEYKDFAPLFKAELYDPKQWADLFARAGARYVVPTSKHHDGFAIWPSAEASRSWGRPWNAVETGPKRDLLGDLASAVRQKGMKFGFYYSLYEWFNPLWLQDRPRFVREHMIPQFKDVVTRYHPSLIFSDGEWDMPSADWKSEELLAWLFNEAPGRDEVVVNDRWGKETRHHHGTYFTTEYAAGMKDDSHPWEENRGMGYSYGYNRAERIDDYKSARELVLVLVDLVSRGGNFLLDIGPNGDGTIPPIMEQRLLEIGDWLKVNGEAIYGTRFAGRASQWSEGKRPGQQFAEFMVKYDLMSQVGKAPKDGVAVQQAFFTKKPDALYAITPVWPGEKLELRGIQASKDAVVTLLGVPGALPRRFRGTTLTITVPRLAPDQVPCQHAYAFKITGATLLPE
ncbi:MAG: alpha-L-fucosidase [Verrucomicrobiales bacterium]|nr:alpha-L-fucosidase [Verrucomicrobiales bacterium]